jgi:hypothetical protein
MLYYVTQLVGGFKHKYVRRRKCLKLYVHHLKYAVNHSPFPSKNSQLIQDSLKSNKVYNSPSSDPNRKILFIFIYVRHNKNTSKYKNQYLTGSFPERKSKKKKKIQIFISFSQLVKVYSLSTQ